MAAALGLVPAGAAAARTKVDRAPHVETYQARLATPAGSPYATGPAGHRAIVQLSRGAGGQGPWRLGLRIFHDHIRPEAHDDLVLVGRRSSGPFATAHTLQQGSYSLYYGRPERQRLESSQWAVPEGGSNMTFTLELAGRAPGSRRALGTVTLERFLSAAEGERLVFDPFANQVLRPTGAGTWVERAARALSGRKTPPRP